MRGPWGHVVDVVEQPLVITALAILAALVDIISHVPTLLFVGFLVLLGFHRSRKLAGKDIWRIQVPSYIGLLVLVSVILFGVHGFLKAIIPEHKPETSKESEEKSVDAHKGIGQLPSARPTRELKLIFKESPALTRARQNHIADEMEAFYQYLAKIGFHAPTTVPPIGVSASAASTSFGSYPADPVYERTLYIGKNSVDDPAAIRAVYGDYAFPLLLNVYGQSSNVYFNRSWTASILSMYFNESFSSKKHLNADASFNGWPGALWEIRSTCGKEFTDRALFYAVGAPEPPSESPDPQMQHFNEYFRSRLMRGEIVVDDSIMSRSACAYRVLNARGLWR